MKSAAPAMQGKLRRAWGKALVSRPAYAVNERRGIYIYICTYIYIDAAAPVFDVDIQASDIIVRSTMISEAVSALIADGMPSQNVLAM